MITTIIALALLTAYILAVCISNKQIPNSLSETVFFLPPGGSWLWIITICAVAFLAVPTFIEKTADSVQFLAFLSCASLAFVAVCPLLGTYGAINKEDQTYKIHMGAAYACGALSQIAVIITCPWMAFWWAPWMAAFIWITKDGRWNTATFWAEMTCFASTFNICLA